MKHGHRRGLDTFGIDECKSGRQPGISAVEVVQHVAGLVDEGRACDGDVHVGRPRLVTCVKSSTSLPRCSAHPASCSLNSSRKLSGSSGRRHRGDQCFKGDHRRPGLTALILAGARKSVVVHDTRVVLRHDGKPGTQIFAYKGMLRGGVRSNFRNWNGFRAAAITSLFAPTTLSS